MADTASFRFSPEVRALLREHTDFFAPLVELHRQSEAPLRIQGKDPEARTETRVLPNGDREVAWVYPIDDNADPADGRLYLRDTFVFDPSENILKRFDRGVTAPAGLSAEWQTYLEQNRVAAAGPAWDAAKPEVERFARQVALGFSRPMVEADGSLREELREALFGQAPYLGQVGDLARRYHPDWKLKAGDPQSSYTLIPRDGELEIVLNFAVDVDGDPEQDRIFLRERFRIDLARQALLSHERNWEAGSESPDRAARRALQELPLQAMPSLPEAEAFIRALLPALLPSARPDPLALLSSFARRRGISKSDRKFAVETGTHDEAVLPPAARQSLEAIYAVAQESLAQRADASRGWGHFGPKVDEAAERFYLETLFQKAEAALVENPGRSPFTLLRALALNPHEARLRGRLLADPLLHELNDLAFESDPELRAAALVQLARQRLLMERGLPQSALSIAQSLRDGGDLPQAAEEIAAMAEGRGDFGEKFDFILPRFAGEVSKPSMLLGMAAAPFFGTAFELLGLKFARWVTAGRGFAQVGGGFRLGAAVLGMGGEALGFTGIHRGFERWGHGPETAWRGAGKEILSATLLFGGLRLANGGSLRLSGALGNQFGRFLHHSGGLAAMTVSGYLSRGLDLAPNNGQGFGGHFFDASVMYLQAMTGFRIAHHAAGGKLQGLLGAFKARLAQGGKLGERPTAPPLGSALLLRAEEVPSLRLFDLNQDGLQSDFLPGRSRETSLDFLLFGSDGKKIRLFRDAQGQVFIEDRRDRILPWVPGQGVGVNLREQSLLHNGQLLPAKRAVPLRAGDSLFFPVRNLKITLPRESELFRSLAALPEPSQRALAEELAQASDLGEWIRQVEARSDFAGKTLAEQLREVLAGRRSLYELPTELGLLNKTRGFFKAELLRWEQEGLHQTFFSLKPEHRDPRWTPLEKSYHTLRAVQVLSDQVRASRSVGEIQGVLLNSPFESIEDVPIDQVVYSAAEAISGFFSLQTKLSYAAGIRQRVRDIHEEKAFREYEAYRRRDAAIPLPEEPQWREEYVRLDEKRAELFALIRRGIPREDPDQTYSPQELEERLYQVLERGKPLSLLPRAGRLRGEAAIYQKWAIRSAKDLFKDEMNAEVDPWTGENISAGNEEAQYRLAIHLLNSYGRRPVTGMPSSYEITYLHELVSRHLDPQVLPDYPVLQETLRRHWDLASPQVRQMLLKSSPQDKAMLLHHYFGSYRRRDMSPAAAFQTAFWMGQAGMYRETGVIYENFRGGLRATFSLGEMDQVSSANVEDYFLLHTHPEMYLDVEGRLMGYRSENGANRTIMVEIGEKSRDTTHVLPSMSDIRLHFEKAQDYWNRGFVKNFGDTPVYDAGGRVFRNWVVHPLGLSEFRVKLDEAGRPTAVEILFAMHGFEPVKDVRYRQRVAQLENLVAELGVPVLVRETPYQERLEALPFPVQPLF